MLKSSYSCLTDAEDHFEDEPVQPPSGKSNGGKMRRFWIEILLTKLFVNFMQFLEEKMVIN